MASRSADIEQRVELALDEFTRKRDAIGEEILRIKAETIKYVEDIFNKLEATLTSQTTEVDRNIDDSIAELRKLIAKKREVDQFMEKLHPVLNLAMEPGREAKKSVFP